jgi:hypothetical protein
MENELKMKFIDPQEPSHEGLHYRMWVSKEEVLKDFPNQPERSKREDFCNHEWTGIPTTEEAWCMKCGIETHELQKMRCSEHCGNTVREVQ